jgi:hypothetical protein
MAENFVGVAADGAGAKIRTRERVIGANTIETQYVIVECERVRAGQYMTTSFRTLGTAATPQNIFTIENPAGSAVLVAVRRLSIQMDTTVALATVVPSFKTSRTTGLPTGGTTLAATKFDTTHANAVAIARGGNASDGGVATAITATPVAGAAGWTQMQTRLHTAVGQVITPDLALIPMLSESDPIILRAGEALVVQGITASAATSHFVVNLLHEEFTLP